MRIDFAKLHGLGNDVVVVDNRDRKLTLSAEQIRRFSDRHRGVGFDQLLSLESVPSDSVDFGLNIFNADGGPAEQCGNGARCIGLYIHRLELSRKKEFLLKSSGRTLLVRIERDSLISCDMARPRFEREKIPVVASLETDGRYRLRCAAGEFPVMAVSMGNPHVVLQVDDIRLAPVASVGAQLVNHRYLPEGANVGFMQVIRRDRVALRVYERGVGETLACGTGACAAVVAGQCMGLLDASVTVCLPGGELTVYWGGGTESVWMTGPAEWSFEGTIDL